MGTRRSLWQTGAYQNGCLSERRLEPLGIGPVAVLHCGIEGRKMLIATCSLDQMEALCAWTGKKEAFAQHHIPSHWTNPCTGQPASGG